MRPECSSEVLRLHGVDVVRQSEEILSGIDLTIRTGEHWALIGPNGAGKSTLLSLCGAETHPTRGSVYVLGHQLGRVDIRKLRESIGHVNPRHPLRTPLPVRDIVLTGATGTTEIMNWWQPEPSLLASADYLIEALGLAGLKDGTWLTMSQGERGRALIARALLSDPALLLLDEPSTGLDIAAREQFLSTLDHLHSSRPELATVLVTHHLEELPVSTTHAMLIARGQICAAGRAAEVLTSEAVTEAFGYPITVEQRGGRWQARANAAF